MLIICLSYFITTVRRTQKTFLQVSEFGDQISKRFHVGTNLPKDKPNTIQSIFSLGG